MQVTHLSLYWSAYSVTRSFFIWPLCTSCRQRNVADEVPTQLRTSRPSLIHPSCYRATAMSRNSDRVADGAGCCATQAPHVLHRWSSHSATCASLPRAAARSHKAAPIISQSCAQRSSTRSALWQRPGRWLACNQCAFSVGRGLPATAAAALRLEPRATDFTCT